MLTLYTLINHPQVRIDEDLRSNFRLDSSPVLPYRANYMHRKPSSTAVRARRQNVVPVRNRLGNAEHHTVLWRVHGIGT